LFYLCSQVGEEEVLESQETMDMQQIDLEQQVEVAYTNITIVHTYYVVVIRMVGGYGQKYSKILTI